MAQIITKFPFSGQMGRIKGIFHKVTEYFLYGKSFEKWSLSVPSALGLFLTLTLPPARPSQVEGISRDVLVLRLRQIRGMKALRPTLAGEAVRRAKGKQHAGA